MQRPHQTIPASSSIMPASATPSTPSTHAVSRPAQPGSMSVGESATLRHPQSGTSAAVPASISALGTCRVCYENEINTVLLPCGHIALCAQCATRCSDCPICRTLIRGTVRSYIPWTPNHLWKEKNWLILKKFSWINWRFNELKHVEILIANQNNYVMHKINDERTGD